MKKKTIIITSIIIVCLLIIAIYSHSTPERSIRTYLFFHGHPVECFKTTVFKSREDSQYGKQYSCKNPGIGFDFFSCKKILGFIWVVDKENSGGG